MRKKRFLFLSLSFIFLFSLTKAQILEPVTWKIMNSPINANGESEITFKASIKDSWHIYGTDIPEDGPRPTIFVFEDLKNVETVGKTVGKSDLKREYEPTYKMNLNWYEKEAVFTQKINISNSSDYHISGYVEYMVCNNVTCLPPDREPFEFGMKKSAGISENSGDQASSQSLFQFASLPTDNNENTESDYWTPVADDLKAFGGATTHDSEASLWSIFLKGIFYGLIAIITPCVWPIIPMTVSFFLKRGKDPRKGKRAALGYGFSIIFIYVVVGIITTLIFEASALNSLSTNATFNILIFALLILFSISFFGGFEIALPGTWSSKIDQKADKTTGFLSILLMAFTLVIVSFSCTGPLIGTLLVDVSMGKNLLAPAIGMLGFAVALAGPFTIFAFFPSWLHNLPRSGGWLNSVKVILGFLELAFALKFLSIADLAYGWHILDREVFIALWIAIFSLLGFYFLGKIHFHGDDPIRIVSVPRFLLALLTFAFVVYLVPGMFGAPLKAVSAFAPPINTQDFNLDDNNVHAMFDDYDDAMKYAEKHKKPVIIDFSGAGCVNCRKMEATVWNDPKVKELLMNDYVLVTLWVDDRKKLKEPFTIVENEKERKITTIGEKWSYLQRYKFGANAQPYYIILDNKGKALNPPFVFSENANEFISFLEKGLENYHKKKANK